MSAKWTKSLLGSARQVWHKNTHENPEAFLKHLERSRKKINSNSGIAKAVLVVLGSALDAGFIDMNQFASARRWIKVKPTQPDHRVPSDAEVQATLNALQGDARVMFLSLLYSGLRCTELQHIIRHKLPVQQMPGFVKVSVNWQRGRKNCIFGYFPSDLYAQLKKCRLAVTGFKSQLKKKGLTPAKYCRKVFYTTARSAGAPSEVCDFIQGRAGTSVGQRHYLDGQRMSDQWYPSIIVKLDAICRGKTSKPSKPLYATRTSEPTSFKIRGIK